MPCQLCHLFQTLLSGCEERLKRAASICYNMSKLPRSKKSAFLPTSPGLG